jgi:hypothetical protein
MGIRFIPRSVRERHSLRRNHSRRWVSGKEWTANQRSPSKTSLHKSGPRERPFRRRETLLGHEQSSTITPASVTLVRWQVVTGAIQRKRVEVRVFTLKYENA